MVKPKIGELEKFKKIVYDNSDTTKKELRKLYGGES